MSCFIVNDGGGDVALVAFANDGLGTLRQLRRHMLEGEESCIHCTFSPPNCAFAILL